MLKKIIIVILMPLVFGCIEKPEPKEILFVCTHGAARSPIAAAYFNKIAEEQDLNYHASFRGTEPDKALTDETIKGLVEDGFHITNWKPEIVSKNDIDNAFLVVTFDCELPSGLAQKTVEQWNGTPSISKDYQKARDIIKEKVVGLAASLSKN